MSETRGTAGGTEAQGSGSPFWTPLRRPAFAWIWTASMTSLVGSWMQDVSAGWLMKRLAESDPLMVALIQVALSVPIMLLVVPGGTIADLVDRRRFLLVTHAMLLVLLGIVTAATTFGVMTPMLLLGLTALVSVARALTLPGFAAAVPGAATREELPQAVGLYSISNNIGRMVGPALAGFVIAAASIQASYLLGLVAVAVACVCILRSEPSGPKPAGARQGFRDALLEGIRYCFHTPEFRNVLARVVVYFACAVSVHSLLPVLMTDAHWFGLAWAAYGGGAIVTATVFPSLVARLDTRGQLTLGIVAHSILLVLMAWLPLDGPRIAVMAALGASWYVVISSAQLAIQRVTPDRFRARGLGFLSMTLMGGFAVGSACWGAVARAVGPPGAMTASAIVSLLGLAATFRLIPRAASAGIEAAG